MNGKEVLVNVSPVYHAGKHTHMVTLIDLSSYPAKEEEE
jgi:hypothetical protein